MKTTVTEHDFVEAFKRMGRGGQFSRDALLTIFEYLEELEDSTGEELELDVIGICCDFTEYEDALEAADQCLSDWTLPERDDDEDDDDYRERALQEALEALEYDCGAVLLVDGEDGPVVVSN